MVQLRLEDTTLSCPVLYVLQATLTAKCEHSRNNFTTTTVEHSLTTQHETSYLVI